MKIITGHTNMDLDSIASMALAKYLYPGYQAVKSRLVNPVARKMLNLYQYHLNLLHPKDLKGQQVDHAVIVDCMSRGRVREVLDQAANSEFSVDIYDHHPGSPQDFSDYRLENRAYGANATLLGKLLMEKGISLDPEDATIGLTGVYADTGNFTHENVTDTDFQVASFFLSSGASLELVKTFLKSLTQGYQLTLFHELVNQLDYHTIHGHRIITSYTEVEEENTGIGAVVEKVFEVENQDMYLGFFHFPKSLKTLIIGRNSRDSIDLGTIMSDFGGGGHAKAASVTVKNENGRETYVRFMQYLDDILAPAVTAGELMSRPVLTVHSEQSLVEASKRFEESDHTGMPVVDDEGALVGMLTLRDIMKGRRGGQMHAPVKGYMNKRVKYASDEITIREIEDIFFQLDIGHLPIVENGRLVGIITRRDYLNYRKAENGRRREAIEQIGLENR
ncbi:MAG: CBS domain-containing protein [Spirochaetales bacterium]|nr:CBS domain-containing protein [Spirochaetales bacterium]MCF7938545.1 CBS domain-containing protein [Spirochaetales bacterium]